MKMQETLRRLYNVGSVLSIYSIQIMSYKCPEDDEVTKSLDELYMIWYSSPVNNGQLAQWQSKRLLKCAHEVLYLLLQSAVSLRQSE